MDIRTKIVKFPNVGDILSLLLLFFLPQLVVGMILNLSGVVAPATSAVDAVDIETFMSEQEALGLYNAWVYPLMLIPSLIAMFVYVRLRGGKGAIRIGCSPSGLNPTIILVGVLWLISAQILLEPLLQILPPTPPSNLGLGVWAYITALISAPVIEEVLCRGLLFETLNKRWGVTASIFISALFFGVIHFDLSTAIVALVAGVIFGVFYVRTSSIFTTIIIHSINNAIAFSMITFERDSTPISAMVGGDAAYYTLYGVAAVIFVVASVEAYFNVLKPKSRGKRSQLADVVADDSGEKSGVDATNEDTAN